MQLYKVQVLWTGGIGLPGLSTFYFDASKTMPMPALRTFFAACASGIPNSVTVSFPTSGVTIDDSTGAVVGSWTDPGVASVPGTATGGYSAPVGAVIEWKTGVYTGGRELKGKTFLVPLTSGAFTTTGQVGTATKSAFETAANALLGGANPPRIYSPKNHTSSPGATSYVPTKPAVLRSRRD